VLDFNFNLFDKLGENENTFSVANTSDFSLGTGKLRLDLGAMYTTLTETAEYDRLFIDIRPHYEFDYKKYTLDIGININYLNDFGSTNKLYPAPYIKAETYIVPKKLRAYLGITGELEKNTLKSLSYENLFLGDNTDYTSPRGFKFYGGMNGSFKRFIEFGVKLQHEIIRNQYFFVNDTNTLRNFTTVYDDLNRTTVSGELKFDVNQNVDLGFRGNFYSYQANKENEAWHMPTYDVALFTTIRIADKIYVNGGYFATSSRKSRDLRGTEYSLAAINDINIGAEYRYKKNISGFINVNNILNQRYEMWNFYRAQGLNVLAGVTFSL
jgi:outer membrane receptor protein involved in Fe transport